MLEIKNIKKMKRELLVGMVNPITVKIAFLCGSSPGGIPDYLEIFLLERGLLPVFYIGSYNRYYEDAVFGDELLSFSPDIIYFHTTSHNIINAPEITDGENAGKKAEKEFSRLKTMWDTARKRFSCVLIQNNFDLPLERALGNLDCSDSRGMVSFISCLNSKISEYARETPGFLVQDIAYLSAAAGLSLWHSPTYMHLYKYAVSVKCMPMLAHNLASIIASVYGKRKKCVVLDLDNTLWGGTVGEAGASGIKAGPDSAEGEAFSAFQKYLRSLKETGVLLAVASKNEEEAALSGLNARGMLLRREDFAAFYANWEPKHENIRKIAAGLNIGLDSVVFIDDNPAERELIRQFLPEVSVIEASEPIGFLRELDKSGFFEPVSLSADDVKRAEMYTENVKREALKAEFENYSDYLKSLKMKCIFKPVCDENAERAAALINKTNQFNLTGLKMTEAEALASAADPECITVCGRLSDIFGDNGLVTVFIGRVENGALIVLQWVMSCRVFGRELELALFDDVVWACEGRGITRIIGKYIKTPKNRPVEGLYERLGFAPVSAGGEEIEWLFQIHEYKNKNCFIEAGGEEE